MMSTIEVAHEVRGSVDYLVGAEGFVQNAGWPYHRLLESLRGNPEPDELARQIVENYFRYYSDYLAAGVSTDQSVIYIGEPKWNDFLIAKINNLAASICTELKKEDHQAIRSALVLAHWEAQSFNFEQCVDLYDFCERLAQYLSPGVHGQIKCLCDCMKCNWDSIVPLSTRSGPSLQFARGLSIYFPWSEVATDYGNLAFARDTGWYDFLKLYVDKTCREPRDDESRSQGGEVPTSIQPTRDGTIIGVGGYPVHRALGAKGGGPLGAKGGGPLGAKGGGPLGAKGGGPLGAKGGGPLGAKFGSLSLEELIQLTCMKNFPAGFYQPPPPDVEKVKEMAVQHNAKTLKDRICNCPSTALTQLTSELPDKVKEILKTALCGDERE
jgi:hypothetical protein